MASTKRPASPKPADEPKAVAAAPAAKAKKTVGEAKPATSAKPGKKAALDAAAPAPAAPAVAEAPAPAKPARSSAGKAKASAAPVEAVPVKQASEPGPLPDQVEIDRMIAEAAYYLAEKRNFQPGFEKEDWVTATAEVMAKLRGGDAS